VAGVWQPRASLVDFLTTRMVPLSTCLSARYETPMYVDHRGNSLPGRNRVMGILGCSVPPPGT